TTSSISPLSLHDALPILGAIPAETMRVARAAYPKGTLAMRLRDELGAIYRDEHFVGLFPSRGQPAEAPWRLAIVLVLQYVEGLRSEEHTSELQSRENLVC